MSSIKTYLFTHRQTGELIFAKKSRRYDYSFDLPDVDVSVVTEGTTSASSDPRFQLIRKKLEALIFLRTSECMMIEQIEKTLTDSAGNMRYQNLLKEEKLLALTRVRGFFVEKHAQVTSCATNDAVAQFLKDMSDRVNLGVYSVMNQERKNLDGQKENSVALLRDAHAFRLRSTNRLIT